MKQFNMPTGTGDSEVEGSNPVAYAPVAMIHILGLGYEQNGNTSAASLPTRIGKYVPYNTAVSLIFF